MLNDVRMLPGYIREQFRSTFTRVVWQNNCTKVQFICKSSNLCLCLESLTPIHANEESAQALQLIQASMHLCRRCSLFRAKSASSVLEDQVELADRPVELCKTQGSNNRQTGSTIR